MFIFYAIDLSIHYLFDIIFVKLLSDKYSFKQIMVNAFLVTFLASMFFFPKDIIIKPDINYIFIVLFAINLMVGLFIWYNAMKNNINSSKLDGVSIAIYLPLLIITSVFFFKQPIKPTNIIGILFIGFGACMALQ